MPRIELLRPEQRARLRRLRRRIANRELMRTHPRRHRPQALVSRRRPADRGRPLRPPHPAREQPLHPLPQPAVAAQLRLRQRRGRHHTALLETAALEDAAPEAANAPADTQNLVPLLDELSALGDPRLRW